MQVLGGSEGDYIGSNDVELHLVTYTDSRKFVFGMFGHNCNWDGTKVLFDNKVISSYKTYYWLPGDLLKGEALNRIKQTRLKEANNEQSDAQ